MSRAFNGSQYAVASGAAVTSSPLTIAAWINIAAPPAAADDWIVASVFNTSGLDGFWLGYFNSGTGYMLRAINMHLGAVSIQEINGALPTGVDLHVAARFSSPTVSDLFINGSNAGSTNTVPGNITPAGLSDTYVAGLVYNSSSVYGRAIGRISEVGIWAAALADADVLQLARGRSNDQVRPDQLRFYPRMTGRASPEVDSRRSAPLSLIGGPAQAPHPRIVYRSAARGRRFTTTSSGTSITAADSGTTAEAVVVAVGVGLLDAGAGNDGFAPAAAVPVADSASATDAAQASITITVSDSASATSAVFISVDTPVADAAAALELANVAALALVADAGTSAHAVTVAVQLSLVDDASAADAVAVLTGLLVSISESGIVSDSVTVTVTVPVSEHGAFADAAALAAAVTLADVGHAADIAIKFAAGSRIATITIIQARASLALGPMRSASLSLTKSG